MQWALSPLDAARTRLMRAFGPVARTLVVDRELRVAVWWATLLLASLTLVLTIPLWVLAVGPVLLGVPHLLGDVRYCVARPGYHRRPWLVLCLLPAFVAASAGWGWHLGLLAVPTAALLAHGSVGRRSIAGSLGLIAAALAWLHPQAAKLALAHGHHAVAIGLWWAWRPRARSWHWLALGALLASLALILVGAFDPLLAATGAWRGGPDSLPLSRHLRSLTGGIDGAMGTRLVLVYALGQSLHYGVWLRMVPEEDRPRVSPRTFVRSWRALLDDLGAPLLAIAAVAALGLAVYAVFDLAGARGDYLRFARFHGVLELAAAALFFVEGRPTSAIVGGATP